MSLHTHVDLELEAAVADFDLFLSQRNFAEAELILENLWDLKFQKEAITLGKQLLAAKFRVEDVKTNWNGYFGEVLKTDVEDVDPNTDEPGGDMRDYVDEQGR